MHILLVLLRPESPVGLNHKLVFCWLHHSEIFGAPALTRVTGPAITIINHPKRNQNAAMVAKNPKPWTD